MKERRFHLQCIATVLLAATSLHGKLKITEFMASNTQHAPDPQGQFEDWVEIYNDSNDSVDLAGYYLTDDFENPTKWQFPQNEPDQTALAARGYRLVWLDGDLGDSGLHAGFKLSADGEELALIAPDGVTQIDSVVFEAQSTDLSYGRDPDAPEVWRVLFWPTPGAANLPGYLGTVSPPSFSHTRGFYSQPFLLSLTSNTTNAQIVYTTDGTDPALQGGRIYTEPLNIEKTTCIRAITRKTGYLSSPVVCQSYLFNQSEAIKSLPIISLVGSPDQTFYEPDGVMAIVGGSYVNNQWTPSTPGSYNNILERGLERPVSFEYFKLDDSNSLQVNCGIRVHGSDWMRPRYRRSDGLWSGSNKFSFRLYFRDEYGPDWLEYPLFPFAVDRFKSIVLRGGHNDRTNPFIKDELQRRLMKDMGHVSSGGSFANLFINGEYKGYFNPCEHITESFCRAWFDSERDWDIISMFSNVREGDREHIDSLIEFMQTHDLSQQDHYETVASQVDIDAFIDYLIVRLWAADWDWPHNNWSAARERSDTGRWRFFVWDGEGGMFSNRLQSVFFDRLHPGTNKSEHENAYLYHALYANAGFRRRFGDRIEKHFGPGGVLTAEHITPRFKEMQDELQGVIPNMDTYVLHTWIPQRRGIFLDACRQEGVYTFSGPRAFINMREQLGGTIEPGDQLLLLSPNGQGIVYYTTDGSDPADHATPAQQTLTALVTRETTKHVHVPADDLGSDWVRPEYRERAWVQTTGLPGGVGYERNSGYASYISLNVDSAMATRTTCYIRIPFVYFPQEDETNALRLHIQYDDGFIAYLNGIEVVRRNFSGTPTWNSTANADHPDSEATSFVSIDISNALDLLQSGDNLLALHGLNRSMSSSDFLINAELFLSQSQPLLVDPELPAFSTALPLSESIQIKARTLANNSWSSLMQATYGLRNVQEGLRITELMYHPLDQGDPNDPNLEYIELKNIADTPINLALVRFTDGIDFEFPHLSIDPGALVLVVRNEDAFTTRIGPHLPVIGQYRGSLNNGGEWIELQDATGKIIQRFRYRDNWYPETDGEGYSLTVIPPHPADPNALSDPHHWQPSLDKFGSPGYEP